MSQHLEVESGPGGEFAVFPSGAKLYPGGAAPASSVGAHGEEMIVDSVTEVLTVSTTGATTTSTAHFFPAGCIALGMVARVIEALNNVTSWAIGDGSDVDAYIDECSTLTIDHTEKANGVGVPKVVTADTHAVVTTAGGTQNTTGKIRVTSYFLKFTAPTS